MALQVTPKTPRQLACAIAARAIREAAITNSFGDETVYPALADLANELDTISDSKADDVCLRVVRIAWCQRSSCRRCSERRATEAGRR